MAVMEDEYVEPNVVDFVRALLHEVRDDRGGNGREKVSFTDSVSDGAISLVARSGVEIPEDTPLPQLTSGADCSSPAPSRLATDLVSTGDGFDVVPNCEMLAIHMLIWSKWHRAMSEEYLQSSICPRVPGRTGK